MNCCTKHEVVLSFLLLYILQDTQLLTDSNSTKHFQFTTDIIQVHEFTLQYQTASSTDHSSHDDNSKDTSIGSEYPLLLIEDANDCKDVLKVTGQQGSVSMTDLVSTTNKYECTIEITVPESMVAKLRLKWFKETAYCYCRLEALDVGVNEVLLESWCRTTEENKNAESFTRRVRMKVYYSRDNGATHRPCHFTLSFTAIPKSGKPQLELIYSSDHGGYIQTPGWNWKTKYPPSMDSWVQVKVPDDHYLLLSVLQLKTENYLETCTPERDVAEVYLGGNTSTHLALKLCQTVRLPPTVYQTTEMFVHFRSNYEGERTGFRIIFSFHRNSSSPPKLSDGRLNCSVPEWPDFQQHYSCNFVSECVDHEDEMNCPYTSPECGPGFVYTGEGCFLIVGHLQASWYEANTYCLSKGMRLAILNTRRKLKMFYDMFGELETAFVYLGLHNTPSEMPSIYGQTHRWTDNSVAYSFRSSGKFGFPSCMMVNLDTSQANENPFNYFFASDRCDGYSSNRPDILCEVETHSDENRQSSSSLLPARPTVSRTRGFRHCPMGHSTHDFLSCDATSACLVHTYGSVTACLESVTSLPPFFTCNNGFESVPYTLVCDYRRDCDDNSDEDFCVFPPCDNLKAYDCGNQQCIKQVEQCDGTEQCVNKADEQCGILQEEEEMTIVMNNPSPPVIVDLDHGKLLALEGPSDCPDTHFPCPGADVYCMPVFLLCNGVLDCPGHEDETMCSNYTCPGFFRCRGSIVCLHPDHVCDGHPQCPQQDDERLCNMECPANCSCNGLSFVCDGHFLVSDYPHLRYLDARGSEMSPSNVVSNIFLVYLNLANCNISHLIDLTLPNLQHLDLSNNSLTFFDDHTFSALINLRVLSMGGNLLSTFFMSSVSWKLPLHTVVTLDISRISLQILVLNRVASIFPNLQKLNLSNMGIDLVDGDFAEFSDLNLLDLRGCPMTQIHSTVLRGVNKLKAVHADNYKLCCPQVLPDYFNSQNCQAPFDEISSCDSLLRSNLYRVFLSLFAGLSLVGNFSSFVYRVFIKKVSSKNGFDVLVTNLCMSDCLVGVYLAVIGVADTVYQGAYVWHDSTWRSSIPCKAAGLLVLMASEVSAVIVLLITFDRLLVLRFPFNDFRFNKRSAQISCVVVWMAGFLLALVPFLPFAERWNFYGQNGMCLPLPVTRREFLGRGYSYGIMVLLNFVIFLLIGLGQGLIFWSVRVNSMSAADSTKKVNDLTIARRLITVAVSDFLCWFPIGMVAILAYVGVSVPGEVHVAMAIFIYPLKSVLNPFLYTLNLVLEMRAQAREEKMLQLLLRQRKFSDNKIVT